MPTEPDRTIAVSRYDPDHLYRLPERDWQLLLGPQTGESERMTMSIATLPPGAAPPLHVHPAEEEMVYVLSGTRRLINEGVDVPLAPGVAFCVPVGVRHCAANDGATPLRLLCIFDPPMVPGSYEAGS